MSILTSLIWQIHYAALPVSAFLHSLNDARQCEARRGGEKGRGLLMAPHQNQFSFVEYLCTLQSNLHGRASPIPLAPLSIAHPCFTPSNFTTIASPRTGTSEDVTAKIFEDFFSQNNQIRLKRAYVILEYYKWIDF